MNKHAMGGLKRVNIRSWIRLENLLLFSMALVYIVTISNLAIISHNSFYTNAWDLGIYAQALYSTLNHGKLLYYTVEAAGNPSRSLFGIHFMPFLLLLVPIYAIYQNPITLLVLRPIAISIGLIPLYWILRENGITRRWLIIYFAALYLVYPPTLVPISNFDILSFLPALFLFALYYLRKRKFVQSYIFIILALMVNEFVSLIVASAAIYVFLMDWRRNIGDLRRRRINSEIIFSIVLLITGILWFISASAVITYFNPNALVTKWEWGDLGSGPKEIIFNILTNPIKVANALFNDGPKKFSYIVALLGPFAFISLLEPLPLIMALPWLTASLLSINPLYYSIETQYPAFVSPFIFLSAIDGMKRLVNFNANIMRHATFIAVIMLLSSILLIPPGTLLKFDESNDAIWMALAEIPPNASVSIMPDIYPHVCNRLEAYPYFVEGVDYVLVNIYSWWYDVTFPRPSHIAVRWCDAKISDEYGIVLNMRGVILYKRGYRGDVKFDGVRFNYGIYDVIDSAGKIVSIENGTISVDVLAYKASNQSILFFKTPFKYLPPGKYNVTVSLMVLSSTPESTVRFEVRTKPGEVKILIKEFSGELLPANRWENLDFSFSIDRSPMPIEIAVYISNLAEIYFQHLSVIQISGD